MQGIRRSARPYRIDRGVWNCAKREVYWLSGGLLQLYANGERMPGYAAGGVILRPVSVSWSRPKKLKFKMTE
jgi:hypothetical protein